MPETIRMEHAWPAILDLVGLRARSVLRRAALPADLFRQPEPTLTVDGYARFWDAMAAESGDPDFGLKLGQALTIDMFDPAMFAALCSPDLNTALQRLSLYKRLVGPCRLALDIDAERTVANCSIVGLPQVPQQYGIAEMTFKVSIARHITRVRIQPVLVTMPRLPDDVDAYIDFFGAPVARGEDFTLAFSALDARRPILTTNDAMWDVFEPSLKQRLSELTGQATVAQRAHSALLELLPSGRSQMQDVAGALGIGTRTLQRRLSREGTRFQDVLRGTREQLARHYLTTTELTTTEIAFLLGFDSHTSLFRAFHRWTGTSPEKLRAASRDAQ